MFTPKVMPNIFASDVYLILSNDCVQSHSPMGRAFVLLQLIFAPEAVSYVAIRLVSMRPSRLLLIITVMSSAYPMHATARCLLSLIPFKCLCISRRKGFIASAYNRVLRGHPCRIERPNLKSFVYRPLMDIHDVAFSYKEAMAPLILVPYLYLSRTPYKYSYEMLLKAL